MKKKGGSTSRELFALYVRNFIFGVEDSLVSTVGMLAGIATAGINKGTILISGVVLIFVEAFSMGIGTLLSEHSAQQYLGSDGRKASVSIGKVIAAGFIMFLSYFITGFIPLGPYMIWEPMQAFYISIGASLFMLFVLGLFSARLFKINPWLKGLEMFIIGGLATLVGVVVGGWVNTVVK